MDKQKKWRLILGKTDEQDDGLEENSTEQGMDNVMEALYNDQDRKGGLGKSAPNVNRWLGDIRKYFPKSIVQLMQKDALERIGLEQLLLEPELLESFEPDLDLITTIISLNHLLPERTKETARIIVKKVVDEIMERLKYPTRAAVRGALSRAERNRKKYPKHVDWNRTIRSNLKNFRPEINAIIPDHFIENGRRGKSLKHIYLLIDQSGSMSESIVYAGIFGSILASLQTIETKLIAFDTNQVDLTHLLDDPVELLFGTQLGGGTDIGMAMRFALDKMTNPVETIMFLISDLYEGAEEAYLLQQVQEAQNKGVRIINILALDDKGKPFYDKELAGTLTNMGIPSFACTPDQFPALLEAAIENRSLDLLDHIATVV